MNRPTQQRLRQTLDSLYHSYVESFHRSPIKFLTARRDPILFPHRYSNFHDVEASAFLASTFAYGNVSSIGAFLERLLAMLGPSPYAFLKRGPKVVEALAKEKPYYRFHKSTEILAVLKVLSRVYVEQESLYAVFLAGSGPEARLQKEVLSKFVARLRSMTDVPLKFLLPSPEDGSTCKRLNLFLRWMVRRDGIDFGIWREISPAALIMPTDTHIGRIAYRLGWIHTPSLTWQKAEQITTVLRKFDPDDPTRYDFSLCHESIARSNWLRKLTAETQRRTTTRTQRH